MNSLEYLQTVYNDPLQETPVRMRAAALAIPFEFPKLAYNYKSPNDFAERLDAAIARSAQAQRQVTEVKVIPAPRQVSGPTPTKMSAPFAPMRRI
jgi:hypothetical protein